MNQIYECATCGIVTKEKGHLCRPVELEGQGDYCGQPMGKKTALTCPEEAMRLDYQCSSCGRTAEKAELVCAPKRVC